MPSRDDKPTRFKEWVQQAIPGASPEMRDALAKMVSPEMKQAFAELARRFQQPFQEAQDPPVAAPEPSAPAPSTPATTPEPSTPEAATPEPSAPEVPTAPLSASIPPASPPSSSAPSAPPASSPAPAPSTPRRLGRKFPPSKSDGGNPHRKILMAEFSARGLFRFLPLPAGVSRHPKKAIRRRTWPVRPSPPSRCLRRSPCAA